MSNLWNRNLVDPSVTAEEIQLAHDGTPAPFPTDDSAQDSVDAEFEAMTRGLTSVIPNTPHQAILAARDLRANRTNVGVNNCLATVRGPIFGLPAVDPDANAGFEHAQPFHRYTDLTLLPRGMVVWFRNVNHGHVVLSLGGGLCSTTDYHVPGLEGVALLSKVADWCGATDMAGGEMLERFDVWPDPKKPTPAPRPWGLADRELIVHTDLRNAKTNHASKRRIDGLHAWDEHLLARMDAHNIDRLALR